MKTVEIAHPHRRNQSRLKHMDIKYRLPNSKHLLLGEIQTEAFSRSPQKTLHNEQQQFIRMCLDNQIPRSQAAAFLHSIAQENTNHQQALIKKETLKITRVLAQRNGVSVALNDRHQAVQQFILNLLNLQPARKIPEHQLASLCRKLTAIRRLTVEAIEQFSRWEELLMGLQKGNSLYSRIMFQLKGKSFFDRLSEDLLFLKDTVLARYITFSHNADPLLLFPLRTNVSPYKKRQRAAMKELFITSQDECVRIEQAHAYFRQRKQLNDQLKNRRQLYEPLVFDRRRQSNLGSQEKVRSHSQTEQTNSRTARKISLQTRPQEYRSRPSVAKRYSPSSKLLDQIQKQSSLIRGKLEQEAGRTIRYSISRLPPLHPSDETNTAQSYSTANQASSRQIRQSRINTNQLGPQSTSVHRNTDDEPNLDPIPEVSRTLIERSTCNYVEEGFD